MSSKQLLFPGQLFDSLVNVYHNANCHWKDTSTITSFSAAFNYYLMEEKRQWDIQFLSCREENQKKTKKTIPFFLSFFSFGIIFSTLSYIFSFFQVPLSLIKYLFIYKSFLSSPLFPLPGICLWHVTVLPVASICCIFWIDLQVSAAQWQCQLAPKQYSQSSQSLHSYAWVSFFQMLPISSLTIFWHIVHKKGRLFLNARNNLRQIYLMLTEYISIIQNIPAFFFLPQDLHSPECL